MLRLKICLAFSLLCFTNTWGKDGDTIKVKSTEGVEISFLVISESDKTCQVGLNRVTAPAISMRYNGKLTIPSTANDYSVVGIGDHAFFSCDLSSVILPNSVTYIDRLAFGYCNKLNTVQNSNKLKTLARDAFYNCSSLSSIDLPNTLTEIGQNAFYNCSNITSITIPNSVTSIGDRAFYGCSGLTSANIPNSLSTLSYGIFGGCKKLASIKIPNSIIAIRGSAFEGCESFTIITIPSSVISIGYNAFYGCSRLTEVIIPAGVTSIGINAFQNCTSLNLVISEIENPFSIDESVFLLQNGVHSTLQVPQKKKSSYQQFSGWTRYFSEITEKTIYHTLSIKSTGNGEISYNGETIRNTTKTYAIEEGTSISISISPDTGYRIKSLKVNNSVVTASTSYIATINSDTSIEVEFEAIPPTTHTLSIKATGNGSASYGGDNIRGTTKSYTLNAGTSVTVSFTPDNGYRIKSLKVNNSSVSATSSYTTTIKANTAIEVEFEAIPATTYTLSIKATGNGSASYGGQTIRGATKSFTVNEGTSVTVSFTPDSGYRIKSLKVNNSSVTAASSYTTTIKANTTIEVEFEAIPATTYTLSIKATGNGSASYGGQTIRGTTKSFTVNEGTSVTISFTPDTGYRIKSLKVNNTSVTAANSYTTTIKANTTIEVEFEAIPATTYTLSIKATGNGSASYGGQTIRGTTKSFTVNEGTSVTVSFTPDTGYRIKSLKVNNSSVTAASSYTTTIKANTTIEVEFEAIPATTYTLSIKATGNGSASYGGQTIRGATKSFTVNEGTSVTVSFSPDSGYRIKSLKVNNSSVTAASSYTTTINANTTIEVEFEAIPATTYTLSIKATGNGSASYGGQTIRGTTKSFTVNDGTSVTVSFSPDSGYRIKSLKVNNSSVTAASSYTTTINANTTIEAEFEAIPATTYTLSIKATGNGSASYSGQTIRGTTKSFTVNEGTSITVSFSPDTGYRIKSLKVNNSSVTAASSYTTTINANTTIEVEFEAIPPTTYTLSIKASGNGNASYGGQTIRGTTKTYTVNEGTSVIISFSPDNGYRIKSVKVNNSSVTASSSYTTKINANTTIEVVFEAIPVTNYSLSLKVEGNGYAEYSGVKVRNESKKFSVAEGSNAQILLKPDTGNRIKTILLNDSEVSAQNGSYTISNVKSDNSVSVVFEEINGKFSVDGINYEVASYEQQTVVIGEGDYGLVIDAPEKVVSQGLEWSVSGISNNALNESKDLAAIIWNPSIALDIRVKNPNLLLYVKDAKYAPSGITNVVVGDNAASIILSESQSGNNFYCPIAFVAQKITYSHRYRMWTGINETRGWETIALPFDVQKIVYDYREEIIPFAKWNAGSTMKPFWLYQLSAKGFVEADGIKANTPYIISMPNNEMYQYDYILRGTVTFSAENAEVKKSDAVTTEKYGNRTFIPNFVYLDSNLGYYALNVNNDYEVYQGRENEGSVFIQNLRGLHPFEAYMTSTSGTRAIGIFDDMTTSIKGIYDFVDDSQSLKVYNLNGQCVKIGSSIEEIKQALPSGVYIINRKKMIIK